MSMIINPFVFGTSPLAVSGVSYNEVDPLVGGYGNLSYPTEQNGVVTCSISGGVPPYTARVKVGGWQVRINNFTVAGTYQLLVSALYEATTSADIAFEVSDTAGGFYTNTVASSVGNYCVRISNIYSSIANSGTVNVSTARLWVDDITSGSSSEYLYTWYYKAPGGSWVTWDSGYGLLEKTTGIFDHVGVWEFKVEVTKSSYLWAGNIQITIS